MARPIEPTPVLRGQDATRLIASLDKFASEAEMDRRRELGRQWMSLVTKPKGRGSTR
jgi:hypothetical protein